MSCLHEFWGLEFSPDQIAACRNRNGLLSLELELSRACNLRCLYCYASSGKPLENELSYGEILSVIDQAAALGARKIIVIGGGEPLLHPRLFAILAYIRGLNLEADLFTNATLIDAEKAHRLYDLGVAVSMKLNSLDRQTQDFLAGREGTFDAIMQGLSHLRTAGYPDTKHVLGIETIICRQNYATITDLWNWARKLNIVPYFEVMTMQGRALDNRELEVSPAELQHLFENLAVIDAQQYGNRWTPHPPLAASHCARHEYSCTVTALGDVNPCPGVSIPVGNVRSGSLEDILHTSPVINDLRNIRTTVKGRCGECEYNDVCYGCRGHAYQTTGDHLAEDPTCWIERRNGK